MLLFTPQHYAREHKPKGESRLYLNQKNKNSNPLKTRNARLYRNRYSP